MVRRHLLKKFIRKYHEAGFGAGLKATFAFLVYEFIRQAGIINLIIDKHRGVLSDQMIKRFGATVRYGPFKGLKLADNMWHGGRDRASMLLGLYEQEVLNCLAEISPRYKTFVDIGAADGYYGIGVLVGNLFAEAYCYEISSEAREIMKKNAKLNGVADRIHIKGAARCGFWRDFQSSELNQAVFLIDIEGGEFDLLDKTAFAALKDCIIIIELHDSFFRDGHLRLTKLIEAATQSHTMIKFETSGRDLANIEEVRSLNDAERGLICSEGRPSLMGWLRLDPKES
jgi:hypothetical protein